MASWSEDLTWQTPGATWNVDPGVGATSQAQSSAASGVVLISGAAETSQVQSSAAEGRQITEADASSSQAQSSAAAGTLTISSFAGSWDTPSSWNEYTFGWGGSNRTAQTQNSYGFSNDVWYGFGETSGVQAAAATGFISLAGDVYTGQQSNELRITGRLIKSGAAASSGGSSSARGLGAVVIPGRAQTAGSGVQRSFGYGTVVEPADFRPTFTQLLRHPHRAVFDKSSISAAAIRFDDYDGQLNWRISGSVLEVEIDGLSRFYGLEGVAVGQVVERLRLSGINAVVVGSEFSPISGLVLVDEDGAWRTDRDAVYGFTSLLWVLFYAYAKELGQGRYQVLQALRQMVITQAGDEWLDLWGSLYGVGREFGESDKRFAPRIPQEAFRLRVNAYGIEKAIFEATGWDVRIEEPWKEIFTLDVSVLSGPHRLYDGGRIGYHLIRPVSRETVDWTKVMAVIERNRAAGVLVVEAESRRAHVVDAGGVYQVETAVFRQHAELVPYQDRVFLDFSNIEDQAVPNHPAIYRGIDGMFRRTQVPYFDTVRVDEMDIEDEPVQNHPAVFRRESVHFGQSILSPLPTATSRHVSKDNNEIHLSESRYEDRHFLDFAEIEYEPIPVLPAVNMREIYRFSQSVYAGQSWDVAANWVTASAQWNELRETVEVRVTRSS